MIVKKTWHGGKGKFGHQYTYMGLFLFGIIPLYITRITNW